MTQTPSKKQNLLFLEVFLTSMVPPFEKLFQDIQFMAVWACAKEVIKKNILKLHALALKNS